MEEQFNDLTQDIGGRYVPSENENDILLLNKLCELTEYKNRLAKEIDCLPNIYIDIVNNNEFEAMAILCRQTDRYFIAFYKGIIKTLFADFSNIVNDDKFYKRHNILKGNAIKYRDYCMEYALEFLLAHEISHVRFGHLAYKKSISNENAKLCEAYSLISTNDNLFSQTIEMDADCCGIATVLNRMFMDQQLLQNEDPIALISAMFDLEERLYCLSFAINYLNEKLFNRVQNIADLNLFTHPHPGIRQSYLTAIIDQIILEKLPKEIQGSLCNTVFDAFKAVEYIMHGDNLKKENLPIYLAVTKYGYKHFRKINDNWKIVRELLKPYSFDDLAPYEEIKDLESYEFE